MNAAGWPDELVEVFDRSITAEFVTLTRAGTPVTVPTTPYVGAGGDTLDVSTGLTYPAKAERARRDPRVALLFADPVGSGIAGPPVVLVQGLATVRDSDLQANTDRYVGASTAKLPDATRGQPRAVLRRMAWYYARIWIEVTPLHIRWWPGRRLDEPACEWNAPEGTAAPLSDPAPPGARPGAWIAARGEWRAVAEDGLRRLPMHDLTVVGPNGFPLCLPASDADIDGDAVVLRVGAGAPTLAPGPACLTMHAHPERFTGQENRTLVGVLAAAPDGAVRFVPERVLGDWSLAGNKLQTAAGFLSKGRVLRRRLRTEATRRSQPVPRVRFPASG